MNAYKDRICDACTHTHIHIHVYKFVHACSTHTQTHTHTHTYRTYTCVCIYVYIAVFLMHIVSPQSIQPPIRPGMDRHLSHHAVEVGGLGRSPCSQLPSLHDAAAVGGRTAVWHRLHVHGRCAALRVVWLRPLLLDLGISWGYIVGIS